MKPLFLFSLIFLLASCMAQKTMQIEYIFSQLKSDTIRMGSKVINAEETYWFVKNYTDNAKNDAIIDSFAFKNLGGRHLKNDVYGMLFYLWTNGFEKKETETNKREVENELSETGLIYSYYWEKGKFIGKEKNFVSDQTKFKIERSKNDSLGGNK